MSFALAPSGSVDAPTKTTQNQARTSAPPPAVLTLDLSEIFRAFDDGHKGWLSMQDVQAATLALTGTWPEPEQVLEFFRRGAAPARDGSDATDATSSGATSHPVLEQWEYFRVKTPSMLQQWLLESSISSAKYTGSMKNGASSPSLQGQVSPEDKQPDSGAVGPTKVGTVTWEEVFDALDLDTDGAVGFDDLQAVMASLRTRGNWDAAAATGSSGSNARGCEEVSIEELSGCLHEILERSHIRSVPPGLEVPRREFLRFVKQSPGIAID